MTFYRVPLIRCLLLVCLTAGTAALADDGSDADWSTRLLQQKAVVERAQQALDERSAAYAKAVAARAPELRVAALRAEREAAAAVLAEEEVALPQLVEAARAAGASEEVLVPYRYVLPPGAG